MLTTLERLKAKRDDAGFTLIELLIVIIILAILATIVIFAVGTTTKNAAVAACKSTVKTIQTAVEAYRAQSPTATPGYPATLTVLTTKTGTGTTAKGPWLKELPTATVAHSGFAITVGSYTPTSGTFNVKTKTTTKAASTAAACNTA